MVAKTVYPDYPFSSHYLQLDGGRMHYIDEGTGPVIVMVHGNPTWSYYFRHLISLLQTKIIALLLLIIWVVACPISRRTIPIVWPSI